MEFRFDQVENYLNQLNRKLPEIKDYSKLKYFLNYQPNNNFIQANTKKIFYDSECFKAHNNKILKDAYKFYLQNFFNFLKSQQMRIYKNDTELLVEKGSKTYFVKTLNLNFKPEEVLNLLEKAESYISFDLFSLLDKINNDIRSQKNNSKLNLVYYKYFVN